MLMEYKVILQTQFKALKELYLSHARYSVLTHGYFYIPNGIIRFKELSLSEDTLRFLDNENWFWNRRVIMPNNGAGYGNVNYKFFKLVDECNGNIADMNTIIDKKPNFFSPHDKDARREGSKRRWDGFILFSKFPALEALDRKKWRTKITTDAKYYKDAHPNDPVSERVIEAALGSNLLPFKKDGKDTG